MYGHFACIAQQSAGLEAEIQKPFAHGSEFAACSLPGATLEHLSEFSDYIIVITLLVAFS